MKLEIFAVVIGLAVPLQAQIKRAERKSLLDSDPSVVYLEQTLKKPIELKVTQDVTVFSDKESNNRLGTLRGNQIVKLEAMTDKRYRVRGRGMRDGISGWVTPSAFVVPHPEFVANLKKLYDRQIQVQGLITAKKVAIGMTLDEVAQSQGKATKTSLRKTATGESMRLEFIEYEEIKHYVTEVDRATGKVYRRLASVTQEEKSKTVVEFENNLVTAIEESEDRQGGNVRMIVPPLVFHW